MRPGRIEDFDRKITVSKDFFPRIVMRNGSDTWNKIFQCTPQKSIIDINPFYFLYWSLIRFVDIIAPFDIILIWRMPKPGIQVHFQMIMGVDKSGVEKMIFKTDSSFIWERLEIGSGFTYPAAGDSYITMNFLFIGNPMQPRK